MMNALRIYCYSNAAFVIENRVATPLYPSIFGGWQDKSNPIDERFRTEPPLDPLLIQYHINWVKTHGEIIREAFHLDAWVGLANVTNISLGKSFLDLDPFWIEAINQSVHEFVDKQNKESSKYMDSINNQIEQMKSQGSLMQGATMPSLLGK